MHLFPWSADHLLENSGAEGLLHVFCSVTVGVNQISYIVRNYIGFCVGNTCVPSKNLHQLKKATISSSLGEILGVR